jgi:protein tyrosine/serine phosphatase
MFCALQSSPKVRLRALWTALAIGAVVVALLFGIYASTGVLGDNEHVVVPGKLYRSAQLSTSELDRMIAEHHLASVVSLRKSDPPAPELVQEQEHLDRLGLAHDNVPLSPLKMPRPDALVSLLARFDQGPYPMLVHCEEGADRTGLAMVIWLVVYEGRSVADARAQELSWRSGHFAFGQAHAMDDFFDLYERTSAGSDLRTWIRDTYPHLFDSHPTKRADVAFTHDRG